MVVSVNWREDPTSGYLMSPTGRRLQKEAREVFENVATLRLQDPVAGSSVVTQSNASLGDYGAGLWRGVTGLAPGALVDDQFSVIVPSSGPSSDGSGGWLLQRNLSRPPIFQLGAGTHIVSLSDWGGADPATNVLTYYSASSFTLDLQNEASFPEGTTFRMQCGDNQALGIIPDTFPVPFAPAQANGTEQFFIYSSVGNTNSVAYQLRNGFWTSVEWGATDFATSPFNSPDQLRDHPISQNCEVLLRENLLTRHATSRFLGVLGEAPGTFTDPDAVDGMVVLPTGGDGSRAWVRVSGGFTVVVADDQAIFMPCPSVGGRFRTGGMCFIGSQITNPAPQGAESALFWYDIGTTSPALINVTNAPFSNSVTFGAGVPTGTTGADGMVNIFATAGGLYIENRIGSNRLFFVNFFAGF